MKAVALGGWRFHAVVGVQNEKNKVRYGGTGAAGVLRDIQ